MRFMNWSTRLDDPSRRMTARRKLGGLGEGGARLSDARAIPRSRPGCGAPRASWVIRRGSRPIAAFSYREKTDQSTRTDAGQRRSLCPWQTRESDVTSVTDVTFRYSHVCCVLGDLGDLDVSDSAVSQASEYVRTHGIVERRPAT